MTYKIIQLSIPEESNINMGDFSPEEIFFILKIGSGCLLEGRKSVISLTQKEIQQKIQNDFKEEIQKLEMNIYCEKELSKQMEERMAKMYDTQVTSLKTQIDFLSSQLKTYELENKEIINEETKKTRDKYEILLKEKDRQMQEKDKQYLLLMQEKDKQNQLNREVFDKASLLINKNINKSSAALGEDGENIFEYLSDTFKDFVGYKIENKAKQGHKGDFHLFFEEFNVLVDLKNYTGIVNKKEVIKIESDLTVNDNMNFAWMVSLNSHISDQNRFPITKKWITTDKGLKCILFINNLLEYKNPSNILRQAWFMTQEFFNLTKKISKEDGELENFREKEIKQKKQIENLQERTNEMRRNINTSFNILKHMENDLQEMLTEITDKIIHDKFDVSVKIKYWWQDNIEFVNDGSYLSSSDIWYKFKRENKDYITENKLTIEMFKEKITSLVSSANYVEKNKKSAIEFIGYKIKEKPENIIIEKEIQPKIKKIKTEVLKKYYFNEELDNGVLDDYEDENHDIMTISSKYDVRPWEVVSLLMKYKIINTRKDSRGYDMYTETEEYKINCKK
jgi:hypothetical protein